MFANRISSSTSCSICLPETSPPSSSRDVLRHRFQSCNTSGCMLPRLLLASAFVLAMASAACAETARATVNTIDAKGVGSSIGTVSFEETNWGLLVTPDISGLPAGVHGLHIHEKAACGPAEHEGKQAAGFAAGGHLDPNKTGKHLGPYNTDGHEGDLP